MFDTPSAENGLLYFLSSKSEALHKAVLLLGGPPWVRRFLRITCDLEYAGYATPKIRRELNSLRSLLAPEKIHVAGQVEAGYFARIDPASGNVQEICRLTDGLEDAMIGQGIAISACPDTIGTYETREVWQ
ncbi:hypothetical protein [Ruegeria arenilitoris]|uniref:hypothetical protein n=1 Tax=Ruegeria arenilitoris TaxID=1173585 RepID=UPI00147ACA49|nr:hypothetical protein [Ruegeria arenilitoris]